MLDLWCSKWHWDRLFSKYFNIFLLALFHQCSILVFIYTFLLPEGQKGEAEETCKKQRSVGTLGALNRKALSLQA
jgi:hypothetical protein